MPSNVLDHLLGRWVVNLENRWWLLDDGTLTPLAGLESVEGPVRVLTDFGGNISTNVETVNGPASYAEPLIEKRLRETGALDGPGRVLIHATRKCGGTTRVLYSAMPVETYATYVRQAAMLPDYCLIFSYVSAMYWQAISGDGNTAVVFQHGRRFDLLAASGRDLVGMTHASAFSASGSDMEDAASDLSQSLRKMMAETEKKPSRVLWFSFGGEEVAVNALPDRMAKLTELPVETAVEEILAAPDKSQRTSIRELIAPLRGRDAINGIASRLLFQAEKMVPVMTAIVLAISLALLGVSWRWSHRAHVLQAAAQVASRQDSGLDLQRMAEQLPQAGGVLNKSSVVRKQFEFLSELRTALVAPDLRRIVRGVRAATPVDIHIVGIAVAETAKGFTVTIEGEAQSALRQAVSDLQQLTSALRAQGYRSIGNGGSAMDENNAFRLTMMLEPGHDQV